MNIKAIVTAPNPKITTKINAKSMLNRIACFCENFSLILSPKLGQ